MFWSTIGRESVCVFLPSGWSQQRRTRRDTSRATSSCQTARRCWRSAWTCTACHWRPCRRVAGRFSPPHTGRWTAPPAESPQSTKGSFFPTAALHSKKPAGRWQLLASYSLQSPELLSGWIIDRVAHWCGDQQLLRRPFFRTLSFLRLLWTYASFTLQVWKKSSGHLFFSRTGGQLLAEASCFCHCRLLIEACIKHTCILPSAASEIVGSDTWLRNTSSAIIDFHTEDSK